MASVDLIDFVTQARHIAFYHGVASAGQHFACYLVPRNRFDENCVGLMLLPGHQKPGHLAREAA